MSKAVLVINDPMFCSNCLLARNWHQTNKYFCGIPHHTDRDYCFNAIDIDSKVKPDWCSLKSLPAIDNKEYNLEWSRGYQGGWNDCIKAITGDKND